MQRGCVKDMLRTLFTIAEKYEKRKVCVYGINRNAIVVFTRLAYRGVDVQGFVDLDDRCVGQYFMNRLIIGKESVCEKDGIVVVISQFDEKEEVQRHMRNTEVCYIDEILDLNSFLKSKKVVIYGIGKRGEEIYKLLEERGIMVCDICVSQKMQDVWHGRKVHDIKEIGIDCNMAIVIATKIEKYKKEMIDNVRGCVGDIFVDEFVDYAAILQGNFFQVINKAIIERKDIYLCSDSEEELAFIEDILVRYQVPVVGRVSRGMERGGLANIYNLAYKDIDKITVIIPERNAEQSELVCDILDEIGFSLEEHNYTSFYPDARKCKDEMKTMTDCLVGHASKGNGKLLGYVVYGEEKENFLKIMVLGGSTSTDGYYRTKSWVSRLYEKIEKLGIKVVLYNGSACGYDIVQELMRLMRDGNIIKPDYVISMSGVNNTNRKKRTKNQFCVNDFLNWIEALDSKSEYISGVSDEETLYDFWIRNTIIMKMVCELWGGEFYSFLQPMNIGIKDAGLYEISMYEQDDCLENTCIFRERARNEKENTYTNLIDIFDTKEKMYIDNCHYSNEANDILAGIVYNTLLADIKERAEGLKT